MELNSVFILVFGVVIGVGLCGMGVCEYFKRTPPQEKAGEK